MALAWTLKSSSHHAKRHWHMFYGLGNIFEWAPTRIEVKSLFSEMECKYQHNLSQRRIENTTTCSNVDFIYKYIKGIYFYICLLIKSFIPIFQWIFWHICMFQLEECDWWYLYGVNSCILSLTKVISNHELLHMMP